MSHLIQPPVMRDGSGDRCSQSVRAPATTGNTVAS